MLLIPLFNEGKDYMKSKMKKVEVLGESAKKAIKYKQHSK